jgi:hypothetical protein
MVSLDVRAGAPGLSQRKLRPVKFWALLGACFIVLQIYVYTCWIASGDATSVSTGPTQVPAHMRVAAYVWQSASVIGIFAFAYWYIVRPLRRDGRLGFDGWLCLAFLTMYWQDILYNYVQPQILYNSVYLNHGSWFGHVPGWMSANAELNPEPLLAVGPMYFYLNFFAVLLGCAAMRKASSRWPRMGHFGLFAICFAAVALFDAILEPLLILPWGMFTYAGVISNLTLFYGHYYQYPIYEAFFAGLLFAGWASLRYFRDDRGQTLAERGLHQLRISGRKEKGLRFLALAGAANAAFLVLYNIPMALIGSQIDSYPRDVLERSYFTNGICGPGSDFACPGPDVPIRRPGSAHLGPSGELRPADGTEN